MTYCLGIMLPEGLVLASDSRSNAGVDQITLVRKLDLFDDAGDRTMALLSAGNLATTQSIVAVLHQNLGLGDPTRDLYCVNSMFNATQIVGQVLREVVAADAAYVQPYGDPAASLIFAGQISGEQPRLFQIYSAGNFVEASPRSPFLQIGETKYGKPILDRALKDVSSLDTAAMLALISFDATIRSNLSVEAPIDMLRYRADSFMATDLRTFARDDPYWVNLRRLYADGLMQLVNSLPLPPTGES